MGNLICIYIYLSYLLFYNFLTFFIHIFSLSLCRLLKLANTLPDDERRLPIPCTPLHYSLHAGNWTPTHKWLTAVDSGLEGVGGGGGGGGWLCGLVSGLEGSRKLGAWLGTVLSARFLCENYFSTWRLTTWRENKLNDKFDICQVIDG